MIPRLKPYLGKDEFLALFQRMPDAVQQFEGEFARTVEARHAIAFPYGRSALWALFKTLGVEDAEVVIPAYTCVVVAHAVVLSGNRPRFVDIALHDYNMDLAQFAAAINERTRAVIPTHLFGYPMDVDAVNEIVCAAESRCGHKIWVIQDCAHSFGAKWKGKMVCNQGDAALFGLNISKMITSIFGGMLTTNDDALAERIRRWRGAHFSPPTLLKRLRRSLYLLAVYLAFDERLYGFVNWLAERTPILNRQTKAYHLDDKIHFPPDYLDGMLDVEAQVGLAQLRKYPEILRRRQENAWYYSERLQSVVGLELPPLVEGATYSHYVPSVLDRTRLLRVMAQQGVQLGELIEYSLPHMKSYLTYADGMKFPNSLSSSQHTINLPIYATVDSYQRDKVVAALQSLAAF